MRKIWIGIISAIVITTLSSAAGVCSPQKLTIAYTGDTAGYVLPCG